MCVFVSTAFDKVDVKQVQSVQVYRSMCERVSEGRSSRNRWEMKRKMTFVDVLVQLVDKSIQLLPLLAGKLQCIAGMNPLTQRTADTSDQNHVDLLDTSLWGETVIVCILPGANTLTVGPDERKQRAKSFRSEPLRHKTN